MNRGRRGPNQYRGFEEQPTTTNGVYGFEVLSQAQMANAEAANRARVCCLPSLLPVKRPLCLRRSLLTDLVAVNPRVEYFIAPRLCSFHEPPYTPKANKRNLIRVKIQISGIRP
ncbi:hypothetical protein TcWFU_001491 [Taenia crassiceps]|uniref:Uncharacterized protein n=1 Tax=Taenia crassiceps TaxID=6207 RepID=A0ABR4Q2C7_9CEST